MALDGTVNRTSGRLSLSIPTPNPHVPPTVAPTQLVNPNLAGTQPAVSAIPNPVPTYAPNVIAAPAFVPQGPRVTSASTYNRAVQLAGGAGEGRYDVDPNALVVQEGQPTFGQDNPAGTFINGGVTDIYGGPMSAMDPVTEEQRMFVPEEPGFVNAIKRGTYNVTSSTWGMVGAAADAVGAEDLAWFAHQQQQAGQELANKYPKYVDSITQVDSLAKLGGYLVDLVGEQVPQLGLAATTGIAGAAGATAVTASTMSTSGTVGANLMKRAFVNATNRRAAQLMAQGVSANRAVAIASNEVAKNIGAQIGIVASTGIQEAGSNWGESVETRGFGDTNPVMDIGMGLISGLSEIFGGEVDLVRKLTGKAVSQGAEQSFKRKLLEGLRDVPQSMMKEGGTEAFQELVSVLNQDLQGEGVDITSDDLMRMFEAGVAGAVMGGTMGGAGAFSSALRSSIKPDPVTPAPVNLQAVYEEERNRVDPYTQVSDYENKAFGQFQQQQTETVQRVNDNLREGIVNLTQHWNDLSRAKKILENPSTFDTQDPEVRAAMQMLQPERDRQIKKLNKDLQRTVARISQFHQNRREAIKRAQKLVETAERKKDQRVFDAQRKSVVENERRRRELFNQDPFAASEVNHALEDADVFANRQFDILNKKQIDLFYKLDQYSQMVNDTTFAETNPNTYSMAVDVVNTLQAELTKLEYQKRALRTAATDVARTLARTVDMNVVSEKMNKLYSLADKLVGTPNNSVQIAKTIEQIKEDTKNKTLEQIVKQYNAQARTLSNQGSNATDSNLSRVMKQIADEARDAQFERLAPEDMSGAARKRWEREQEQNAAFDEYYKQYAALSQQVEEERRLVGNYQAQMNTPENQARRQYQRENRAYQETLRDMEATRPDPVIQAQQQISQAEQRRQRAEQARFERQQYQQYQRSMRRASAAIDRLTTLEKELNVANANEQTQRVYNFMSNALDSLPGLIDVTEIVSSVTDNRVPVALQNAVVKSSMEGNPFPVGAYFDGKLYVFASQVRSKQQAVRTLMHEGVAHYGLRAIMSPRTFTSLMSKVFNDMSGTTVWRQFEQARPAYGTANPLTRAEEFCAWLAERESPRSLLNRAPALRDVWRFIRNLFRKLLGIDTINDQDIRDLLSVAARHLANPEASRSSTEGYLNSRLMIQAAIADMPNVAPEYTYVDVNKVSDTQVPYGWGLYFSNAPKAVNYLQRLSQRLSGVPGNNAPFNVFPENVQFLNWNKPLSEQQYILEHVVDKVLQTSDVQFEPHPVEGVMSTVMGKQFGPFTTQDQVANFRNNREFLSSLTGEDLYTWIAKKFDSDPKRASSMLRDMGVAGNVFINPTDNQNTNFCLFEGDELSETRPAYTEPEVRFLIEEDTPTAEMNPDYVARRRQELAMRQSWWKKVAKIKNVGKSVGPDGKVIEHSWVERNIERFIDPHRRVLVVERAIAERLGKKISTFATNIYAALTGLTNRINAQRVSLWQQHVDPVIDMVKKVEIPGIGQDEDISVKFGAIDNYLMARHATERNREINSRWGHRSTLDAPSGMSDETAARYIEQYDNVPGMREIAEKMDEINRLRLDYLERYRLVDPATIEKLRKVYKHYVPLKNWDEFISEISPEYAQRKARSGISQGGKDLLKKAKGRDTGGLPESPFVNSIVQLMDVIQVGEKNEVSRKLLDFVRNNPDKDMWEVASRPEKPVFKIVENGQGQLQYKRKGHQLEGEDFKYVNVITENGARVRVAIKDEALAAALRNENLAVTSPFIDFVRTWTHKFGAINTNYNPVFIIKNYPKDIQTALVNVGVVLDEAQRDGYLGDENTVRQGIIKDALSFRLFNHIRKEVFNKGGRDPYLTSMYNEFKRLGGHTRMFSAQDFKSTYVQLRDATKKRTKLGEMIKTMADYTDKWSDISENATRFSVFLHLVENFEKHVTQQAERHGWDKQRLDSELEKARTRAANEALEITVNFTRKGSAAPFFNALYAFSAAGIGGNVRLLRNLWRRGDTPAQNTARVAKFLASATAGAMSIAFMNRAIMGDDDDGINKYDKIPQYVKDSNMIIANPFSDNGYVKIPLPYGLNVFWIAGNSVDSIINNRGKVGSNIAHIAGSIFDNFSPIGGTEGGVLNLVPTLARPIAQVAANQNSFGFAIMPDSTHSYKGHIPDSQKFWGTNPQIYRAIAQTMNAWTGGSRTESGLIDISPESIEHIIESYTGGVGRTLTDTVHLLVTGTDTELRDVPVASMFAGKVGYNDTLNVYQDLKRRVQSGVNEVDLVTKDKTVSVEERNAIRTKNRSAKSLEGALTQSTNALNRIREQEKKLEQKYGTMSSAYREQKKLLDQRRERVMRQFSRAAEQAGIRYES